MNFFHRGLIRGTAVVYVQLIQTFGITREEAALPLSLVSVIGGFSSLSVGFLTHYLNDRILVVMATLISATGLVLCYTATSMVQINFYYSISQGGCSDCSSKASHGFPTKQKARAGRRVSHKQVHFTRDA
ncbi:hypothetical protein HPB52_024030 [Rhipicephalus sanguineus]|uniref:Monocarboxylate transporter n=1 Tax=Rhipicephalus sanguineus TaxID=34632 RepID=A0A9D4PY31_RHISA|nr:hypothetical protein HPB52_024030 [Rhipicephalus sanguineus]